MIFLPNSMGFRKRLRKFGYAKLDEFVKSRFNPLFVIPAKAGIQGFP